jgi:hypothetical protein
MVQKDKEILELKLEKEKHSEGTYNKLKEEIKEL